MRVAKRAAPDGKAIRREVTIYFSKDKSGPKWICWGPIRSPHGSEQAVGSKAVFLSSGSPARQRQSDDQIVVLSVAIRSQPGIRRSSVDRADIHQLAHHGSGFPQAARDSQLAALVKGGFGRRA
jgi:hypothetical protein